MKRSNLLLAAMSTLCAVFLLAPVSLAQVQAHRPAPVVQHQTLAQILADPKTNFHPITLANGVELGPNIPGRIIVGPLHRVPRIERIAAGAFFLTLLLSSAIWAFAASRQSRAE